MSFRYSIDRIAVFDLRFTDPEHDAGDEEEYRKELRHVERNGQTVRIPISVSNEVVGEYRHFHAVLACGVEDIEVIRCISGTQKADIDFVKKIAVKFPITRRKHKRMV